MIECRDSYLIKREITSLIRMATIIAFGGYQEREKQPRFVENGVSDSVYIKLIKLIDVGKIGEAEDFIWNKIESNRIDDLQLALDIYSYINEKNDDFLKANNFERYEIKEGLKYIMDRCGFVLLK